MVAQGEGEDQLFPSTLESMIPSSANAPSPSSTGHLSVSRWLQQHTDMLPDACSDCAKRLASDGATSVKLLAGAGYSKAELVGLGILRPHAAAILSCLKDQQKHGRKGGDRTQMATSPSNVLSCLATVSATDVLEKGHVLVRAAKLTAVAAPRSAPRVLVALLQVTEYAKDVVMIKAVLGHMVRLMKDPGTRATSGMGAAGALTVLLEILREYAEDRDVAMTVVEAIGLLAINNDNVVDMDDTDASERVVEVTGSFGGDAGAQEIGLKAVSRVGRYDRNKARMHDAGVCDVIMAALKRFPENGSVQNAGLKAMVTMTASRDVSKRTLGALGGCEAVVAAMGAFKDDKDLQSTACLLIDQLAMGNLDNSKHLGRVGACAAVAGVLKSLRSDRDLVWAACDALWRMSVKSEDNRKLSMKEGVREMVDDIRQMYPGDEKLDESTKRLLDELSKQAMYF